MSMGMDNAGLDALVDALTERLSARLQIGPAGERDPRLPTTWDPPQRYDGPVFDRFTRARIGIAGMEFTQSTQHNGSAGPSYGRDNAVSLVAFKTMIARVYPVVQRAFLGNDALSGQRVTGELTLSVGDQVVFRTGPTRIDGVRLGSAAEIDRGSWDSEFTIAGGGGPSAFVQSTITVNCPLNFIVPAYYCRVGRIHAAVRLWPVADGPMSSVSARRTEYLQFLDVPAPKIALVRVNWVDSAGTVNRPTDAQMLGTLGVAGRMLPFPYFETTILGTETTSGAPFAMLSPTPGGCNASWDRLVAELNVTRIFTVLFGLGDIVFGMVSTAAIPAGSTQINSGCGRGAGGGFVGYELTFAHEIGHLYERRHVAVNGDAFNDPNYPNYGGSTTSIGEVGIDTGTSPPTLYDPSGSDDIMSYGNNQWISPYTYQNILDRRGMHDAVAVDPRRLRPRLFLEFRMHRMVRGERLIEIGKSARIEAPGSPGRAPMDAPTPVSIDLLDGNGRILATHHCRWIPPHGCGHGGCGCSSSSVPLEREPWLDFQEVLEWPAEDVASIAFHSGDDPFFTIAVGEAPVVSIESPELRDADLVVRVSASHPRERVSIVVLFSADDGATWQPVAFDPPNNELIVAADRLPGGERCLFRAIGTAELQSATADTEAFALARTPRRLYVDVPSDGCTIPPGPVAIAATVDTRGLGAIAPMEIRWTSDRDGELGFGYSLTPDLREGRHELTATAPDGLGGTLSVRAIIIVGGRPRRGMTTADGAT